MRLFNFIVIAHGDRPIFGQSFITKFYELLISIFMWFGVNSLKTTDLKNNNVGLTWNNKNNKCNPCNVTFFSAMKNTIAQNKIALD